MWGPTALSIFFFLILLISIHGPRVGADTARSMRHGSIYHFNPRPPCGGRLCPCIRFFQHRAFQSTAPVWGPTGISGGHLRCRPISIHGPRVGADLPPVTQATGRYHFNPRPPCGGRLFASATLERIWSFQSTAPVWGPTHHGNRDPCGCGISIHGPRVGADRPRKHPACPAA